MSRKSDKRLIKKLFVGLIVVVVLSSIVYRIGNRWLEVRKFLNNPVMTERLKVVPVELNYDGKSSEKLRSYNIGYASFSLPEELGMEFSRGRFCTVFGKTADLTLSFHIPQKVESWQQAVNMSLAVPIVYDDLNDKNDVTYLDIQRIQESVRLRKFSEYLFMDKKQFLRETALLPIKLMAYGYHQVIFFESYESCGVIWVGENKDDKSLAFFDVYNKSGTVGVNGKLSVAKGKIGDVTKYLNSFFGTFRFTVAGLENDGELKQLLEVSEIKKVTK